MARKSRKRKLTNSGNVTVSFTEKEQGIIVDLVKNCMKRFPINAKRLLMEKIDLAYSMEKSIEELAKDSAELKRYRALALPLIKPNIESGAAYLDSVFLTGYPILGVVSGTKNKEAALQMESIILENSQTTGWVRQLMLFHKDGLKYNTFGIECQWRTRRIFQPITDLGAKAINGSATSTIEREGNEIKRLDLYNTYYDTTVPPADVCEKGDFAGYVERLTATQLYARISELKLNGEEVMNEHDQMWKSYPHEVTYYKPRILKDAEAPIYDGVDWLSFFGIPDPSLNTENNKLDYELTTMYVRIVPKIHKLGVPNPNNIQIWKFLLVNGQYLLMAQRQSNAHSLLPIILGQPKEDGLAEQTKGMGQDLLPYQQLAETMHRARMASLERSISDRGLYDPLRISEKVVNSKVPSAKWPVRPSSYGKGLDDVYKPIPFDDRTHKDLISEIQLIKNWSQEASHQNQSQRGQFVKGNKTLAEYMDVMANAESTHQAMALMEENQIWVPLKRIIKTNILQFQGASKGINPQSQEEITVDPVALREAIVEFKLADGLTPKDKIISFDAMTMAFQTMAAIPGMGMKYDIESMFVYMLEMQGAKLQQFERKEPLGVPPGTVPKEVPQAEK